MALGEFKLFQFKSKKQREKEEREYALWAFPYGDLQKENLAALIQELIPKISVPLGLASFLTCKELFENTLEDSQSRDDAIDKMLNVIKSYSQLINKAEMPMYLALVLADAEVDEDCRYPAPDEMRASIQELEDLIEKPKRRFFKKKTESGDQH